MRDPINHLTADSRDLRERSAKSLPWTCPGNNIISGYARHTKMITLKKHHSIFKSVFGGIPAVEVGISVQKGLQYAHVYCFYHHVDFCM